MYILGQLCEVGKENALSLFYMEGSWNWKKKRACPKLRSKEIMTVNGDLGCYVTQNISSVFTALDAPVPLAL